MFLPLRTSMCLPYRCRRVLRYRYRRHQKAMALGYGIAVVMIVLAFASRLGVVLWFGIGFALVARNLGQRICRAQGCRAFARRGR